VLLAGLYGLYLLYLGLPKLMKAPKEKAFGYTAVTILCAIVLFIVVGAITGAVAGAAMLGGAMSHANTGKMSGTVERQRQQGRPGQAGGGQQADGSRRPPRCEWASDVKLVSADDPEGPAARQRGRLSRTEPRDQLGRRGRHVDGRGQGRL
jgi:hypothetical protein